MKMILFIYRSNRPIDVFITYDGKRPTDIAVSRYAVRHIVSGEVRIYCSIRILLRFETHLLYLKGRC